MSNFKSFIIYSIGFFSLLLGLFLNENSSGGAKIDFSYLFPFIESFRSSFEGGLLIFINNSASIIHSPVFYILISFIYKLIDSVLIIKIFYIFFCSFLHLIFLKRADFHRHKSNQFHLVHCLFFYSYLYL